jgi:hypothetical protein
MSMSSFHPRPIQDLSESLEWKPGVGTLSGRAANAVVNEALHEMDRAFAAYMGQPAVPSLLTYAKHASRTVGSQLARMEATMRFLRYFDLNALADIRRDVRHRSFVRGQARALASEFFRNPFRFYATLRVLRRAIQWGNLQAYESLVPAFGRYLEAESAGADGVAALELAGYGAPPRDPQGLLLQAFRLYQSSHRIGQGLSNSSSYEHDRLVELRQRMAFSATLTLSLHEQMLFQASECYDDPVVKRVVGRLTPTLTIEDPVDTMYLLPHGGNWAEFTDRMGLAEAVDRGEVNLSDPSGVQRTYSLSTESRPTGTIFDYLSSRFLDPAAAEGVAARPLPLPAYDDGEGRALDRLRQSYRRVRGDYRPGSAAR